MMLKNRLLLLIFPFLAACAGEETVQKEDNTMKDVHSYAVPEEAKVTHLDWDARIDFENKIIEATATYDIEKSENADQIVLDTRDLNILNVWVDGKEVKFSLGPSHSYLGAPLMIPLNKESKAIKVKYQTSPQAAALQWLTPQQTAGKKQPFLFTQSQAILARTWIPCQDSPGVRFSYNAKVQVPSGLLALMSARNPMRAHSSGIYEFVMPQPIPSYLMALAVGDLEFKAIGDHTGVYAEPSLVDTAAWEFVDMENMLNAAEGLYGAYAWERYDIIVLPPSFPFGGMENPRLTFATPTILSGDRSLTALVAHELAHSWSGNVVTNSTWNDFWLNEGFTVYFELRIMEEIYGKDYANMLALLGYQSLIETVEDLGAGSPDTKLKLDLEGRDPDDGMNDIAYEKGNFFLRTIEKEVGREAFDKFLNKYFEEFAFKPMTTEIFLEYLKKELLTTPELIAAVKPEEWIYQAGIPENIPVPTSDKFVKVDEQRMAWLDGKAANELATSGWTTHEWLHFIKNLPDTMSISQLSNLDSAFGFTQSGNSEILGSWFIHAVNNKYEEAYPAIGNFLVNVGRRKFLSPIYQAMSKDSTTKELALRIYEKARPNYHTVSFSSIDAILDIPIDAEQSN